MTLTRKFTRAAFVASLVPYGAWIWMHVPPMPKPMTPREQAIVVLKNIAAASAISCAIGDFARTELKQLQESKP